MRQYRFEIVGRAFGRFTWRLVELRGRRRRVLARSDQDYSSPDEVGAAIGEFRENAVVVDTTLPGEAPFELPPTRFEFVEGVVPLVVEESPDEDDELSEGPPGPTRQKGERQEPERQEVEQKEQSAEPTRRSRQRAEAGASTTTRERATRSSGRRRKGT